MPDARSPAVRTRHAALILAMLLAAAAGAMALAPTGRAAGRGSVTTLFAGSLVDYMEHDLGPAFAKSSGYGFEGFGGGSTELANEIKGGVRHGDVFVSASAAADASARRRRERGLGLLVLVVHGLAAGARLQPAEPVRRSAREGQAVVSGADASRGSASGAPTRSSTPRGC